MRHRFGSILKPGSSFLFYSVSEKRLVSRSACLSSEYIFHYYSTCTRKHWIPFLIVSGRQLSGKTANTSENDTAALKTRVSSEHDGELDDLDLLVPSNLANVRRVSNSCNGENTVKIPLREVSIDLHAGGEADGVLMSTVNVIMPLDWRDLPYSPQEPPFWASVWPSSTALAAHILRKASSVDRNGSSSLSNVGSVGMSTSLRNKRVCDLGCGVGTAGLSALIAGAAHVEFFDRSVPALGCVSKAATMFSRNQFPDSHPPTYQTTHFDWHDDSHISSLASEKFDVVLACDVFAEATVVGMSFENSAEGFVSAVKNILKQPAELNSESLTSPTLILSLPAESPYRNVPDTNEVISLLERRGLELRMQPLHARGAQLPGEGPEGLAAARRVTILEFGWKTHRAGAT